MGLSDDIHDLLLPEDERRRAEREAQERAPAAAYARNIGGFVCKSGESCCVYGRLTDHVAQPIYRLGLGVTWAEAVLDAKRARREYNAQEIQARARRNLKAERSREPIRAEEPPGRRV